MPASPFRVEVRGGPDLAILVMAGDLGAEADTILDDAYTQATASGATVIVLDCSAVQFINSSGIALIVRLLADARRNGREVRAFGLSPHYVEIFEITRIAEFVRIFDSPAEALAVGLPATAGGQA